MSLEMILRVCLVVMGLTVVTTQLINALHFRRGIQNMPVYNMEWEIPIPPKPIAKRNSVPPVPPKSEKRLSRAHRRLQSWSSSRPVSPPATLEDAREENARLSLIETGVAVTDSTSPTAIKRDWRVC